MHKKIWGFFAKFLAHIERKRQEKLTIMLIPHNHERSKSWYISHLTLEILLGTIIFLLVLTSGIIIYHTSTAQKADTLKLSQKEIQKKFLDMRKEILEVARTFQEIKTTVEELSKFQGKKTSSYGIGGEAFQLDSFLQGSSSMEQDGIPKEFYLMERILWEMDQLRLPLEDLEKKKKIFYSSPTLWPVVGSLINSYGFIRDQIALKVKFHQGVDILSYPGAEVVATADGEIKKIKEDPLWGKIIYIKHKYAYETRYYGLERVNVEEGEKISRGDTIGYLSPSTISMKPILHYEVYVGVEALNPEPYLLFPHL